MEQPEINLEIIGKSRKRLLPGDIFVLKPKGHSFLFGRIVSVDADCGFGKGALLVYIYAKSAEEKFNIPRLDKTDLLLPPLFTNRLGWSRGYFQVIGNNKIEKNDVFLVHSFRHPSKGCYFDEYGETLSEPGSPTGVYGLHSYKSIADEVTKALGLPRASSKGWSQD